MGPRGVFATALAAVLACFVLPPAGLALGVVVAVLAARRLSVPATETRTTMGADGAIVQVAVPPRGRGLLLTSLVLGVGAALLGLVVTIALAVFWNEVNDYVECREQSSTIQGEKRCDDEFRDALESRLDL